MIRKPDARLFSTVAHEAVSRVEAGTNGERTAAGRK